MFPALFSPHDRLSSAVCVVELLVPVWQQCVALAHSFTDQRCVIGTKEPRLTARSIKVGVGPKEWLISSSLVPTHKQLSAWRLEEATNISYETEGFKCRSFVKGTTQQTLLSMTNAETETMLRLFYYKKTPLITCNSLLG